MYNKTERLSGGSKSPVKRSAETNYKPVTIRVDDVSNYIQNYNQSNLIDTRNTSFGSISNLINSKPINASFFTNSKAGFKNNNEFLNFSNYSKK